MENFLLVFPCLLLVVFQELLILPLDYLGPEILRILLLRWERELALHALISLGLLELDDQLARGKSLPPTIPLTLVLILQLLKLLQ